VGATADQELIDQLAEAAWTAMEIQHDWIPKVVDVVMHDNEIGVVSDYVEGIPLRSVARQATVWRKPTPAGVALRIITDSLEALVELHRQARELGEVSSDAFGGVTPDSVLVGTDGHAHLIDIIVAGAASTVPALRDDPERVAYAAPEQLGTGTLPDARTDLFCTGILLWELLSNRRLFVGFGDSAAQKVLLQKIPRLDEIKLPPGTKIGKNLVQVVARALDRDPKGRPQSAEEMLQALREIDTPVAAPEDVSQFLMEIAKRDIERQREEIGTAASSAGASSEQRSPAVPRLSTKFKSVRPPGPRAPSRRPKPAADSPPAQGVPQPAGPPPAPTRTPKSSRKHKQTLIGVAPMQAAAPPVQRRAAAAQVTPPGGQPIPPVAERASPAAESASAAALAVAVAAEASPPAGQSAPGAAAKEAAPPQPPTASVAAVDNAPRPAAVPPPAPVRGSSREDREKVRAKDADEAAKEAEDGEYAALGARSTVLGLAPPAPGSHQPPVVPAAAARAQPPPQDQTPDDDDVPTQALPVTMETAPTGDRASIDKDTLLGVAPPAPGSRTPSLPTPITGGALPDGRLMPDIMDEGPTTVLTPSEQPWKPEELGATLESAPAPQVKESAPGAPEQEAPKPPSAQPEPAATSGASAIAAAIAETAAAAPEAVAAAEGAESVDRRVSGSTAAPPLLHDRRITKIVEPQAPPSSKFGLGFLVGVGTTLASVAVGALIVAYVSGRLDGGPTPSAQSAEPEPPASAADIASAAPSASQTALAESATPEPTDAGADTSEEESADAALDAPVEGDAESAPSTDLPASTPPPTPVYRPRPRPRPRNSYVPDGI